MLKIYLYLQVYLPLVLNNIFLLRSSYAMVFSFENVNISLMSAIAFSYSVTHWHIYTRGMRALEDTLIHFVFLCVLYRLSVAVVVVEGGR